MAAMTSRIRHVCSPEGPQNGVRAWSDPSSRTDGEKIKALWRSLAPLTFVAVHRLLSPMATRSLFSKFSDPREPEVVRRARARLHERGSEVPRAAEGVARGRRGRCTHGTGGPQGEGRTPRLRSECLVTLRGRHRPVRVPRPRTVTGAALFIGGVYMCLSG